MVVPLGTISCIIEKVILHSIIISLNDIMENLIMKLTKVNARCTSVKNYVPMMHYLSTLHIVVGTQKIEQSTETRARDGRIQVRAT